MTGQLNMFDFFQSLDNETPGEVEMVSLVPDYEEVQEPALVEESVVIEESAVIEEPEVVEEPEVIEEPEVTEEKAVMSRKYERDGEKIEIAYINYNKVRITRGYEEPMIKEFASSKEAVDYYVQCMQELEIDE